jgi:TatA/E family protein of Tat protein translocase
MNVRHSFGFLNLGAWEIILILAVVLLLFGAKQLPRLARGLGESVREFRKIGREDSNEANALANNRDLPAPLDGKGVQRSAKGVRNENER